MKKIVIAAIAAAALIAPATASASVSGAESAIEREFLWNNGREYYVIANCRYVGYRRYRCSLWVANKNGDQHTWTGRARARQYGSRYSVNYSIDQ